MSLEIRTKALELAKAIHDEAENIPSPAEIVGYAEAFFAFLVGGEIKATPTKTPAAKPAAKEQAQPAAAPQTDAPPSSGPASAPVESASPGVSLDAQRAQITKLIVDACKTPEKKASVIAILNAYKDKDGKPVAKGSGLVDSDVPGALEKLKAV